MVIYKKTYDNPIKDKKGNSIHNKEGNKVESLTYWGYVEVDIEGTEIELGDDTVSDNTQSDNDEFNVFLGKF